MFQRNYLFVCVLEITWPQPHTVFVAFLTHLFGASSGFRVAMWKALASDPSKYNNRVISSLSQWFSPVCVFFFCLSLLGWCCILWAQGLVKGESSSSLSRTFSICRSACILLEFFPPIFSCFYAVVVLFPITVYDETTRKPGALWRERNSCLVTSKRVWGKGWVCLEGSGPEVAMSQSVDELFLFWRTRIKGPYLRRSNAKLAFSL